MGHINDGVIHQPSKMARALSAHGIEPEE